MQNGSLSQSGNRAEASSATPSRPPGFSAPNQVSIGKGSSAREGGSVGNADSEEGGTRKIPYASSLGSKGNDMIKILNDMGSTNKLEAVVDDMDKFIAIGECLGYNMADCIETKNKLISRMGDKEVI